MKLEKNYMCLNCSTKWHFKHEECPYCKGEMAKVEEGRIVEEVEVSVENMPVWVQCLAGAIILTLFILIASADSWF
jgi:transcription initiation factor IIE alpha subunit